MSREANSLTSPNGETRSLAVLRVLQRTLKLEDAGIIRINPAGTIVGTLPNGLSAQDIDVAAVQSGQTVSGRMGNLVFAVAPVTLTETERLRWSDCTAAAARSPSSSPATWATSDRAGGTSSSPGGRAPRRRARWPGR